VGGTIMKKKLSTVCVCFILLAVFFAQTALASSYKSTLTMSGGVYEYCSNNFRSFDGDSVTMSMTLKASGCMFSSNSSCKLKASLYRQTGFLGLSRSLVSYKTYPTGYSSLTWSKVGSDKYVWDFNKICDDERDRKYYAAYQSDDIKMTSK
jgi:hypothetical protein